MNQEVEIEFKNIVTKEEFDKLLAHFLINDTDFKTQQNHYFDTLNFSLKQHRAALRIREKNGKATLTLKEPHHVGLLESHQSLSKEEVQKALNEGGIPNGDIASHIINSFKIHPNEFTYLGTLTTSRAEISYKSGTLVFDYSTYLDTEDYEIEYEGSDETIAKETFLNLLNQQHIPIRTSDNKIVRFFTRKANIS
ncbi:CYTH domain-containing protein [Anaerobacillus sp. MEB173]|uniref:CYTH domain-containing protein n=1 Tax=Anaerobacillus sp. MEB173 TaxID=3383345 RepID=UPI003F92E00D